MLFRAPIDTSTSQLIGLTVQDLGGGNVTLQLWSVPDIDHTPFRFESTIDLAYLKPVGTLGGWEFDANGGALRSGDTVYLQNATPASIGLNERWVIVAFRRRLRRPTRRSSSRRRAPAARRSSTAFRSQSTGKYIIAAAGGGSSVFGNGLDTNANTRFAYVVN